MCRKTHLHWHCVRLPRHASPLLRTSLISSTMLPPGSVWLLTRLFKVPIMFSFLQKTKKDTNESNNRNYNPQGRKKAAVVSKDQAKKVLLDVVKAASPSSFSCALYWWPKPTVKWMHFRRSNRQNPISTHLESWKTKVITFVWSIRVQYLGLVTEKHHPYHIISLHYITLPG